MNALVPTPQPLPASDDEIAAILATLLERNADVSRPSEGRAYVIWTGAVWTPWMEPGRLTIEGGDSILNALEATELHLGRPVLVTLNMVPVPRAAWATTIVRGGDLVMAISLPQDHEGGSSPLRILAMIAVVVLTSIIAPGVGEWLVTTFGFGAETAASIATVLVGAALNQVVNALLPAPQNKPFGQAEQGSPTYTLNAQGNYARLGQAVPEPFGRNKMALDAIGAEWTEYENNEVFLFKPLTAGVGKFLWDEFGFADTWFARPGLATVNPAYDTVQYEIVEPGEAPTLFTDVVTTSPEVAGATMLAPNEPGADWLGPYVANPPGTKLAAIAVDIVAPRGLGRGHDNGSVGGFVVNYEVQVQAIDDEGTPTDDWYTVDSGAIGGNSFTKPFRETKKYGMAWPRVQVRSRCTTDKPADDKVVCEIAWGQLKAYFAPTPSWPGRTVVLFKFKANAQVQGSAGNQVYGIGTRYLAWRESGDWTDPAPTRAIAPVLAYIVRRYWPDTRIDFETLESLHTLWEARPAGGDKFDFVFDQRKSAWDALKQVARCGRAQPIIAAGIFTVIRDQARDLFSGAFTQDNIILNSFSLDAMFSPENATDGVRVVYTDARTWKTDASVECVLDGFAGSNLKTLPIPGISSRAHAFREGIYEAASDAYRRNFFSIESEMEGRLLFPGEKLRLSHDLTDLGQAAEVAAIAENDLGYLVTSTQPFQWRDDDLAHYAAFNRPNGKLLGPLQIYRVNAAEDPRLGWIVKPLPDGALPLGITSLAEAIITRESSDGQRVPSKFLLGKDVDTVATTVRVIEGRPRGLDRVSIALVNDDERVNTADETAVPPEPEDPDVPPAEDLTITALGIVPGGTIGFITAEVDVTGAPDARGFRLTVDGKSQGDPRASPFNVSILAGPARTIRVQAKGRFNDGPSFEWTGDLGEGAGELVLDGWLSISDKAKLVGDIRRILDGQPVLAARATALGIAGGTENTAHASAVAAFSAILAAIVPDWDDGTVPSPIDAASLLSAWEDASVTQVSLQTAIDRESAKRAVIVSVSDLPDLGDAGEGVIYSKDDVLYQRNEDGTAIDPKASLGAPSGTPVGSYTDSDALVLDLSAVQSAVADLYTIYGDTVSAAASATAAAASAAAAATDAATATSKAALAALSEAAAAVSQAAAASSQAAASASQTAASSSATAASGSASTASTQASNAATSATAAAGSAGAAGTSATNASTSASSAAGSASSAGTSATAAATSASAAAGSASAASTSASTASTQATNAGNSATAASASAVSASSAAANAAASASAAATSASAASTSAGTAGTQASAASTSATSASTSASSASTSASSASGSATSASGSATSAATSASAAATSATNAGTSASAASTSATAASNSAASAATSAILSATVGQLAINNNSTFTDWPSTDPTNWSFGDTPSAVRAKRAGNVGPFALAITGGAAAQAYTNDAPCATGPGWHVVDAEWVLLAGTHAAAGIYVSFRNSSHVEQFAWSIPFTTAVDATNTAIGAGTVNQRYRTSVMVNATGPTISEAVIYAMAHYTPFGSTAVANQIEFHKVVLRQALASERETGVARGASATLSAKITDVAEVAASATALVASRASVLEVFTNPAPNLMPYGDLSGSAYGWTLASTDTTGFVFNNSAVLGPILYSRATGTTSFANSWAGDFGVSPNSTYCLSAFGGSTGLSAGFYGFYGVWLTAANAYVNETPIVHLPFNLTDYNNQRVYTSMAAPATAAKLRVLMYWSGVTHTGGAGTGTGIAFKFKCELGSIPSLWTMEATPQAVAARVAVSEGALVTLDGKTQAWWELTVGTGITGIDAFAKVRSTSGTSIVGFGADVIALYNRTDSTWKDALRVTEGNVILSGGLNVGAFIRLGSGNWDVQLAQRPFPASDGGSVSFGRTFANLPDVVFSTVGLVPCGTGETYDLRADSLTGSGFTAYLKIITPGAVTARTLSSTTLASGGTPQAYSTSKISAGYADGDANQYTISATFSASFNHNLGTGPGSGTVVSGDAIFDIYIYKSGAWSLVDSVAIPIDASYTTSGSPKTITGLTAGKTFSGPSAPDYFGIHFRSATLSSIDNGDATPRGSCGPVTAVCTAWGNVSFNTTASSGTRTATPAGQTCIATVFPK